MNTLPLLLKREYWEHRGGFMWTPVWICVAILLLTVIGIITAEVLGQRIGVQIGISLETLKSSISAHDLARAGNGLDVIQIMLAAFVSVGMVFVLFFYLLGALYDDRRDRSVLFWKSLPVTDTTTVVSKALAAMFVAPLIALAVASVAYVAFLIVICAWTGMHGMNAFPALIAAHPLGVFGRLLLIIPVNALFALPCIGWLLFWSAFARSKPFMWAVIVPILVLIANSWFGLLGLPHAGISDALHAIALRLLLGLVPMAWVGQPGFDQNQLLANDQAAHILDPARIYAVVATPSLWIGVVAGIALIAAAIWMRGRRIETNT